MEEAICGGVKTWQPVSILSNERQAIKRQAAQRGCVYVRPAEPWFWPPWYATFSLGGVFGALTAPAKFLSGQRWPPARRVTAPSPLGCELQARRGGGVEGWYNWRGGRGGLKKLKDMAPFPISLGDNKKGMLEKGKQREESTKTKARARSV